MPSNIMCAKDVLVSYVKNVTGVMEELVSPFAGANTGLYSLETKQITLSGGGYLFISKHHTVPNTKAVQKVKVVPETQENKNTDISIQSGK